MAMTLHNCPDVFVDNNGKVKNPIWKEWLIEKLYPSKEKLGMRQLKMNQEKLEKNCDEKRKRVSMLQFGGENMMYYHASNFKENLSFNEKK